MVCKKCGKDSVGDLCGQCPSHEYTADPMWEYPKVLKETQVASGVWVRTCALREMNKYGNCWESFAINETSMKRKQIYVYKTYQAALASHDHCVEIVLEARRQRQYAS